MGAGFFQTKGINLGSFSSDPASGSAGDTYFNTTINQPRVYNGSAWVPLSSGGGLGINFISNAVADSTDGWATYSDAAGTTPVDGTGGTATGVTFARNTSSPIDGTADFKLSKDAADRQGKGVSYAFTVGSAFPAGTPLAVSFYYVPSANFVTGDSSDVKIFIYDVTNSKLITPNRNSLILNSGKFEAKLNLASGTSYRFIMHIATTNASAWDLQFKFVAVGPGTYLAGPKIDNLSDYSTLFTANNFGTVTNQLVWAAQNGQYFEGYGWFTNGTPAGSPASITLPPGIEVDPAYYEGTDLNINGFWHQFVTAGTNYFDTAGVISGRMHFDGSDATKLFFSQGVSGQLNQKPNASSLGGVSGDITYFEFKFKAKNFSATQAVAQNGVLRMSDIARTRVTSTPDVLGEYRAYIKDATAASGTDDAPGTAPNSTDGFKIYGNVDWTPAGTAGQTGRFEIFIGYGKTWRAEFYSGAARTGWADPTFFEFADNTVVGLNVDYDPSTGCIIVDGLQCFSSTTTRQTARSVGTGGAAATSVDPIYFDIYVADNDYQIGLAMNKSTVFVSAGNGHGSTNTKIRRFSNVFENRGLAIVYADSATDGATFTIREGGTYAISYSEADGGGNMYGISLNSTNLTTSVNSLTFPEAVMKDNTTGPNNAFGKTIVYTGYFEAGDVIRAHTDGVPSGTQDYFVHFKITKIGG